MKVQSAGLFDRRSFLQTAAAGGRAAVLGSSPQSSRGDAAEKPSSPDGPAVTRSPQPTTSRYWMNTEGTVRDRFWIFCCPANTDFRSLQRRSVMTPAEGAYYLGLVDVVTLWGGAADLPNLDATLEKVEIRIPNKRIMLGCYMFDFGKKESISVDLMRLQCEKGLRWLRQGRIEGVIFLGNTVADFGFPSVEWTRQWIRRIGDEKL